MSLPTEDKYFETKGDMFNQIVHLLGGRCAEALTLDDISTGASNDIQRATDIARAMVTKYGFSEKLGPINYSGSEEVFLGRDFSKEKSFSDGVQLEIDEEVRAIINKAYKECEKILKDNMDKLEVVAQALMKVETIDGDQFERLYTGEIDAEGIEKEINDKEKKIQEINRKEAEESEKIRREEEERFFAGDTGAEPLGGAEAPLADTGAEPLGEAETPLVDTGVEQAAGTEPEVKEAETESEDNTEEVKTEESEDSQDEDSNK
jgi:cell division protease FtsH